LQKTTALWVYENFLRVHFIGLLDNREC